MTKISNDTKFQLNSFLLHLVVEMPTAHVTQHLCHPYERIYLYTHYCLFLVLCLTTAMEKE